jgi:transcriptional regulator with XRE-family HTH domain
MLKTYQQQVSERLEIFGKHVCGQKYGWKSAFARQLGISPSALGTYLSGTIFPGYQILARLYKLGCSSDWLLYGKCITTNL